MLVIGCVIQLSVLIIPGVLPWTVSVLYCLYKLTYQDHIFTTVCLLSLPGHSLH